MYDKDRNLLFTNKEFNNDPYWDLAVANTWTSPSMRSWTRAKPTGCAVL
ncbi:MAG: hypothetical protein IPH00_11660 [Flavobacteriales bacterium]|nr:hypothetical protein [Flavobacteriales bacterium]